MSKTLTPADKLSETFDIFGARIIDNEIVDEPFDYKKDFDGFLIKRKVI